MSETSTKDDAHDAKLAALYRAAAGDTPPPALDAAILAAAHREAGARPRPLGFSFRRTARAALSIAAVLVLSVSLVTLMREEAPEIVSPSIDQGPSGAARDDVSAVESRNETRAAARTDLQTPKSLGLKPSNSAPSSGLALPRSLDFGERNAQGSRDNLTAKVEPPSAERGSTLKRRDQFAADPGATGGSSETRAAVPQRQFSLPAAKEEVAPATAAARAPAADSAKNQAAQASALGKLSENKPAEKAADSVRESDAGTRSATKDSFSKQKADAATAAPAPAPVAASPQAARSRAERSAELPPEKWLERIEELRKQGKLEEARESLAEFRKRYPDYRLPESLRQGIPE